MKLRILFVSLWINAIPLGFGVRAPCSEPRSAHPRLPRFDGLLRDEGHAEKVSHLHKDNEELTFLSPCGSRWTVTLRLSCGSISLFLHFRSCHIFNENKNEGECMHVPLDIHFLLSPPPFLSKGENGEVGPPPRRQRGSKKEL